MTIQFGREICGDLAIASSREWLVTNGIGGYASGTVSGVMTRRYHGLLIGALKPPLARTLLLSQLDETIEYDGISYSIASTAWNDGAVNPSGYRHIEQFQLDGTIPQWHYAFGDALLEKRIWMQPKANTTYVSYRLCRGSHPISLSIKVLVNYRDHHSETRSNNWNMKVVGQNAGIQVQAFADATPFYVVVDRGKVTPHHDWYQGFDWVMERYRGLGDRDDHLHAATIEWVLEPGERGTVVASTDPAPNCDGKIALEARQHYEQTLINQWHAQPSLQAQTSPTWIQSLVLAADQFIVDRPLPEEPEGKTIIAGYPWFGDWGRDTMISLPGLTLTTGREAIARTIIQTFGRYLDQGMLPNVFPEVGEAPEYNTVDAILWYFEAIRAYDAVTQDESLLKAVFPLLAEVIDWHCRGTRYQIHLDDDGLLYAGEDGVQLTWMDAKIGNWVVTPRIGKPIEISALWYHALRCMEAFALRLGKPSQDYRKMAEKTVKGFQRFWNEPLGYCFDVLDAPEGNDDALRPNQLFAVSLPYAGGAPFPLLWPEQQRAVVDACGSQLLTSFGLRSLGPKDSQYQGHYGGNQYLRDSVYHQGTTWGWLIGPYLQAHLQVYQDPEQAMSLLGPMTHHLTTHGMGSISEIFDGDAPFHPRGCFAQAWSVAEILRVWTLINEVQRKG